MKKSRLLVEGESGDLYFTGDLIAAKRIVQVDRWFKVTTNHEITRVEFHDDPALTSCAEWGSAEKGVDAWRYAFGAFFGPVDEDYKEQFLWTMLQIFANPNPAKPAEKEATQ